MFFYLFVTTISKDLKTKIPVLNIIQLKDEKRKFRYRTVCAQRNGIFFMHMLGFNIEHFSVQLSTNTAIQVIV